MPDTDASNVRAADAALEAAIAAALGASIENESGGQRTDALLAEIESRLGRKPAKQELRRILARIAPGENRELRAKPVRSASGVAPLALLTKPFPCPGRCVFCPNDAKMPKSYLSMEPGAQRATRNRFDPFAQTWNRLLAFQRNGHALDKIELIVMGGTFSAYPEEYQRWFVKRTLDALVAFDPARGPADAPDFAHDFRDCPEAPKAARDYDARVVAHLRSKHSGALLADAETATWEQLEDVQRANESSPVRSVGLSIETRPDRIDVAELVRLRKLGVTKVQIGYQSQDDRVLAANRRGCDVAASRRATALLRRGGFKVQAHWMPNLLGATPESDATDFLRLFDDPELRPDELKIYPCALIETAELMEHHASGAWRPYTDGELLELLVHALANVPEYCRVSRVIRDIPSHDIVAGSKQNNLREVAARELAKRGLPARDIRARQIARPLDGGETVRIEERSYALNGGTEHFIEALTSRGELLGFARLHLSTAKPIVADLGDGRDVGENDVGDDRTAALLREVHVYGRVSEIAEHPEGHAQHRGLGRALVARAEAIASADKRRRIAVISAVGTREYYRRLGYRDGELYLVKDLRDAAEVGDGTA